jgi:chromosome segregation ATPase
MANKPETGFSNSKSFRELDEALQHSFRNIKHDMTALKEGQHQVELQIEEAKKELKGGKADFVTIDKFNVIKIKLGELNEGMKKLWDVEKGLEALDKRSVASSDFKKHSEGLDSEIEALKSQLKSLNKSVATEEQVKNLVGDVNEEFDRIKKGMDELRTIKDTITKSELEKRSAELDKKAKDVRADFEKVRAEVKSKVTITQVEALVGDINADFDNLKKSVAEMKADEKRFALDADVEKRMAKVEQKSDDVIKSAAAAIDEFSKGVEVMFKDFAKVNERNHASISKDVDAAKELSSKGLEGLKDSLSAQLADVKKDMKLLVTRKQAESLVNEINKEFDHVKESVDVNAKAVSKLSKESATRSELAAEAARISAQVEKLSRDIAALKKASATKDDAQGIFDSLKHMIIDTNNALKDRFDTLVKMVKKESDAAHKSISENAQDINAVEKDIKKEMKPLVSDKELHGELDVIKGEFERMHKVIRKIRERMAESDELAGVSRALGDHISLAKKEFVSRKQFSRLADTVKNLQDNLDMQNDLLREKDKEIRAYAKELKAAKKAERKLSKYESVVVKSDAKASRVGGSEKPGDYRKSTFLANFLIGAAFVLLIAAIGFFFAGLTGLTDSLSIAAVVCFVVGIIIRIVIGFRKNGN